MLTNSSPDTFEKIRQMGDATRFEPAGDSPFAERRANADRAVSDSSPATRRYQSHSLAECISHVSTPHGKKPVMKTMLTTACERNCYYCPFRAGRSITNRVTVTPDQMAQAFDALQASGKVDGLFLSSGIIKGSVTTQDKIIDTVEIVRRRYAYRGYIHLKVMPGIERDQLYRAMQLADRVSVNLEAPTAERLNALAPKKDFEAELLRLLQWAEQIRRDRPDERLARTVTQFVVGAVGDTDLELLTLSQRLYRQMGLTRAYYSAFHPVEQTPLENVTRVAPIREYRLYQSSFLLRDYGWDVEDLPFEGVGNLRTDVDPKRAWAEQNLRYAPVEIMTADRTQLLRVPGIGPTIADAILAARRTTCIRDLAMLRKIGVRAPEKALPYLTLDGHYAAQLPLF